MKFGDEPWRIGQISVPGDLEDLPISYCWVKWWRFYRGGSQTAFMDLWKVIRLTAWWVYGLGINCQFEEFIELLPKKRTVRRGCGWWWVFMAVGNSSRTGSTRNADQRCEVLVWVSLHSQHQGFFASLLGTGVHHPKHNVRSTQIVLITMEYLLI